MYISKHESRTRVRNAVRELCYYWANVDYLHLINTYINRETGDANSAPGPT